MNKWNQVTPVSKMFAIIFFTGIFPLTTFYLGMQYQKTLDVINEPIVAVPVNIIEGKLMMGDYGYRCDDGTEFTMNPSEDGTSIEIFPATDIERIDRGVLNALDSASGVMYANEELTFFGQGETVKLSFDNLTVVCNPMFSDDMAPMNFGD